MVKWLIMHLPSRLIIHDPPKFLICLSLFFLNSLIALVPLPSQASFANSSLGRGGTKNFSPRRKPIFTQYWAVEIMDGEQVAREVALKYGFTFAGTILPGIYNFRQPRVSKRSTHHSVYYHDQLAEDPRVVWLEQQISKVREKRDVHISVNDPHWPHMWYLNRGGPGGPDMNVRSAWARGYAGQHVVVTILDDGLETDHPDLKQNYDPLASYDVNGDDENPEPRYWSNDKTTISNRHGTRCAGQVAAVANNSICGLGIAYRARIGGVRMLDGDVSDAMESRSLGYQLQHIDVYSASWGPEDDGKTVDGPGRLAQLAIRNGIQMGRGGLGSIFVWASGNGGKRGDNCNCDGYTNSIYTLGVSSVSELGTVPWYAERCSSTLAVTYSSGGHGERGVITTDLNHTCTTNHSGTSASAPLAAGICALTLSANPRLSWRDLQYLVVYTSRPDGLFAPDWAVNGVGRRVSHAFGYGLMDAGAMVDLALNWTNVPEQHVCEAQAPITDGPVAVRPIDHEVLALTTDGCASAAAFAGNPSQRVVYVEHVQAKVTVSSAQRGEIELHLTSPSGTVSKLLSKRPKDIDVAGFHAWPFMSVHFWGELASGTWKLTVHSGNAAVSIHDWTLILYGINTPPPLHATSTRQVRHPVIAEQEVEPDPTISLNGRSPLDLHQVPNRGAYPTAASHGTFDFQPPTIVNDNPHVSSSEYKKIQSQPVVYESPGQPPFVFWSGWEADQSETHSSSANVFPSPFTLNGDPADLIKGTEEIMNREQPFPLKLPPLASEFADRSDSHSIQPAAFSNILDETSERRPKLHAANQIDLLESVKSPLQTHSVAFSSHSCEPGLLIITLPLLVAAF